MAGAPHEGNGARAHQPVVGGVVGGGRGEGRGRLVRAKALECIGQVVGGVVGWKTGEGWGGQGGGKRAWQDAGGG